MFNGWGTLVLCRPASGGIFVSPRLALHHAALVQRITNQRHIPRDGRVAAGCHRVVDAGFEPAAVGVTKTL